MTNGNSVGGGRFVLGLCFLTAMVMAVALGQLAGGAMPATASAPASEPASVPTKVKITISRETTYLLGPVNPDGTINYCQAVKDRLAKGVTPENNAVIPLFKAFGPKLFDEATRQAVMKELNIQALPASEACFVGIWPYSKEHAPAETTDLRSPNYDAAVAQVWDKAPDDLDKVFKRMWSGAEYPVIEGWIKENAKSLAVVTEASQRTRLYVPPIDRSEPSGIMSMGLSICPFFRESIKAMTARALLKAGSGNVEGAWADLLTVHRLARLLAQQNMLVHILLGTAVDGMTWSAEKAIVGSGNLTAKQARVFRADLESLPEMPEVARCLDVDERLFALDCVMMLTRFSHNGGNGITQALRRITFLPGEFPLALREEAGDLQNVIDWDEILRRANVACDRTVAAMKKPTFALRKEAMQSLTEEDDRATERLAEGNRQNTLLRSATGKVVSPEEKRRQLTQILDDILQSGSMRSLSKCDELLLMTTMNRRIVILALAIAEYKAEKGKFPAKLDDLVPGYVKEIPEDFFSGKPLVYKVNDDGKGYVLYSVGPNMKDDGGPDESPKPGADDVGITVKSEK
jgi:hypothetical protein